MSPLSKRQKLPNHFPFAQFARCGECGSMITAQYATNRFGTKYTYYRCTKKKFEESFKDFGQQRKNWVEPLRSFVLSLREVIILEKGENYFA
ncbi:MAG: zinc ribbon domain-containing protein [bacterium]|nr:zinc ribbon domain-containing protein [bacterium]